MNRKAGVIIFIISCLLFMLTVMLATTRYPPAIDIDILTAFKNLQTPLLTIFFRFVTWAGSLFFILPASVAIVYLLYRCQQHVDALFFSVSIISAIILTQLLKYLIARQRPDMYPPLVHNISSFAFPSAHAAQVTTFCLSLFLAWHPHLPMQRAIACAVFIVLVLAVMCSRLYLQVHYPSDVVGGMLLGVLCATGAAMVYKRGDR